MKKEQKDSKNTIKDPSIINVNILSNLAWTVEQLTKLKVG